MAALRGEVGRQRVGYYDGKPERAHGTTARRIPWEYRRASRGLEPSLHDPKYISQASKMRRSFQWSNSGQLGRALGAARARPFPARRGNPAPAACALIQILLDPRDPAAHVRRCRLPVSFAATTRERVGAQNEPRITIRRRTQRGCGSRALCSSDRDASQTIPIRSTCRSTGTSCAAMTPARAGVRLAKCPDRLRLSNRRSRARTADKYTSFQITSDFQHFPPRRLAASIAAARGDGVGGADERTSAGALLRQRAAGRDGRANRFDSCSIYFGTTWVHLSLPLGRPLDGHRARLPRGPLRQSANAPVIRVLSSGASSRACAGQR